MRIKVIKASQPAEEDKKVKPASEAEMRSTIQAWIEEFRSTKDATRRAGLSQSQNR